MMNSEHPYISEESLEQFMVGFDYEVLGYSYLGRELKVFRWGAGPIKVLIWSQMHGNESTGLRAMLNLFRLWAADNTDKRLQKLTILFIPQLNPDGACIWERRNVQGIDINRDLKSLHSNEAKSFVQFIKKERPEFCLNLHDQRSVFAAGREGTGSALAVCVPRVKEGLKNNQKLKRNRREVRYRVLQLLNNSSLKEAGDIAFFDESYYPKAIGEFAQELGAATLLVESGVRGNDLSRKSSVELTQIFLEEYLMLITEGIQNSPISDDSYDHPEKWGIPQNENCLSDVLIRRAHIKGSNESWTADVAIIVKDVLRNGKPLFEPQWYQLGDLSHLRGRVELEEVQLEWDFLGSPFKEGSVIPFWNQIKHLTPWENILV